MLQLVEQIKGVAAFPVHLVDEDDYGGRPHAAHLHELSRLCLHTFGRVDHNDSRVDGSQRTIGVFGKILVTRGIQNVDLVVAIVEFHHGSRHRDTTLLLDVHPVARGRFSYLVALYCSCHLNLSTEEQELLGERGLTGIRVRNDGKGTSSFYFVHIQ